MQTHFSKKIRDHANAIGLLAAADAGDTDPHPLSCLIPLAQTGPRGVGGLTGAAREAAQESSAAAKRDGVELRNDHQVYVRWQDLGRYARRDLTAGIGTSGGYLAQTSVAEPRDILRPWSVTTRAGVQIASVQGGSILVPKTGGKITPQWLADEGAQATSSQPTLQQIVLTPKTVIASVVFSRQLAQQSNALTYLGREATRSVASAMDQGVLNGSGAAEQP